MRILYYTKPCFGDCDFPLVKALMEKGHEIIILEHLTPYSLKTTIFDIEKQYPKAGIFRANIYPELMAFEGYMPMENVYISNEIYGKLGIGQLLQALREIQFIRKMKPDIIHHVEDPGMFNTILLWIFRKELVFTIHDGRPHTGDEGLLSRMIRKTYTKYVKKFILLTKSENIFFQNEYNVPASKIHNSHLGYYEMLKMYGDSSKQKENYILFFGRISPYKGVVYLLQAMRSIHDKYPNAKLIVAGSGKYSFDITEYQNCGYIEFRNRFINLSELADLIRGALFTVCPYTEATQSGVIYSSFALNTPVIATNVGGLSKMVDDGETGIIVPPCDTKALANAMIELLDNPKRLDNMKNIIAESEINGKGSWKKIADEYISIYKK